MMTYKEKAVFGQQNFRRVVKIISANGDFKKLAEISPAFIVMDLTWGCNYHCLGCVDGEAVNRKGTRNLPVELIEDIFDYSHTHGVRGIMTMGGEVFIHKQGIEKALEKSIEYQIPLKTVTNGSLLYRYIDKVVETYKIPSSILRVSINSNKENYSRQSGASYSLYDILNTIKEITSRGTQVSVSTVIFPESSRADNYTPNIPSINEIINDCKNAGVNHHILLPARNPITKQRYCLANEETNIISKLRNKNNNIEMNDVLGKEITIKQNLQYHPCPSGFLFTLVGSDGSIYKCTDNRGRESAILGKIKKRGDFEKFWHSEERVKKQFETSCPNKECVRYKINVLLHNAYETNKKYGVDMTDYLKLEENEAIFV